MERERLTSKIAIFMDKDKKPAKDKKEGEGRDIGDFDYDQSKARILQKALHNINVSLGTMLAAMKDLSILRGSDITPDGKLGGSGFIMAFKDIKTILADAINNLSNVTDTIADELTNPKWGLTDKEKKKVEEVKEEVEEKVETADDIVEDRSSDQQKDTQCSVEDSAPVVTPAEVKIEESNPESIERYKSLLEGPSSQDKTASMLSKHILANLVRK